MSLHTFYEETPSQTMVRDAIAKLCTSFDDSYWLGQDTKQEFPEDFYRAMVNGGWLGIAVPEEYGGAGLGVAEMAICLQTIAECGGGMNGGTSVKLNMFGLMPLLKFGKHEQKQRLIPPIITGQKKLCFMITESDAGLDTRHIRTFAKRDGSSYLMNGSKTWISTAQKADQMLILARTTPMEQVANPTEGLSLFLTDLDREHVKVHEIKRMGRSAIDANQVFIEDLRIPIENRIGEEGQGMRYVFQSMNAERITSAAEGIGIGRAAITKAAQYAKERVVFGRPIGKNQGVQHPLAHCWMELETINLLVQRAAALYDAGKSCGLEANSAKYLAAEAGYNACQTAIVMHGGNGYAREFHLERYLRDIFVIRIAPVSPQLILSYVAERALGLAKSY